MKPALPVIRWMSLRVSKAVGVGKPVVHIQLSKRVAPLAVRRNRIKRLIREALRLEICLSQGCVYWLRVERDPKNASYASVEKELKVVFR